MNYKQRIDFARCMLDKSPEARACAISNLKTVESEIVAEISSLQAQLETIQKTLEEVM